MEDAMYSIFRKTLVALILTCACSCNAGLAFPKQGVAAPQVNKRIAGHRILKTLEIPKTPGIYFPSLIFQDSKGLYYIVRRDHLSIFNEKENNWTTFTRNQLNLDGFAQLRFIAESSDGRVWVSSKTLGHLRFLLDGKWEEDQKFSFYQPVIFPSLRIGIWAADGEALYHYDGTSWSKPFGAFKKPWKNNLGTIFAGIEDSMGLIWLIGGEGVFRYDQVKNEWSAILQPQMPSRIEHIYEDTSGNLWFANIQGDIAFYDRKTSSWGTFSLSDKIPNSYNIGGMVEDRESQILFATNKGLVGFNKKYNQWNRYTSKNSGLLHSWVTCIYKDRSNQIWLGTPSGIMVLEP
jgi:ligand-binding sensor domain-containing protein